MILGSDFKQECYQKFYFVTDIHCRNLGRQFIEGLNESQHCDKPHNICFYDRKSVFKKFDHYRKESQFIFDVMIPNDAEIIIDNHPDKQYYWTNKIILHNKCIITESEFWNQYTNEELLEQIEHEGYHIFVFVPNHLKTESFCLQAISICTSIIEYIPLNFWNEEFYLKAAFVNGRVIKYIATSAITRNICLEAVKNYGPVIVDVPIEFKDDNMYVEAFLSSAYIQVPVKILKRIKYEIIERDPKLEDSINRIIRFMTK
jgi:hypothetical protein